MDKVWIQSLASSLSRIKEAQRGIKGLCKAKGLQVRIHCIFSTAEVHSGIKWLGAAFEKTVIASRWSENKNTHL